MVIVEASKDIRESLIVFPQALLTRGKRIGYGDAPLRLHPARMRVGKYRVRRQYQLSKIGKE